jgi:hypothetical protein
VVGRWIGVALVGTMLLVPSASLARGLRCSEWTRMNPGAQQQTLRQMIYDAPNDRSLQGRQVNATRLQMCLERSQRWIEADFHEACSRGKRENLQVLNNIFNQYLTSCTSGRMRSGYR